MSKLINPIVNPLIKPAILSDVTLFGQFGANDGTL
jgi:hypothetical protein